MTVYSRGNHDDALGAKKPKHACPACGKGFKPEEMFHVDFSGVHRHWNCIPKSLGIETCVKCGVGIGEGTQILWDKEVRPYHIGCFPLDGQPTPFPQATTSEARGEYNPMLPRCNEKGEMPATKYEDEMMNQTTKVHCPACGKMVTNCEHGVSSVMVENVKLARAVNEKVKRDTDAAYKDVASQIAAEIRAKLPEPSLSLLVIDLGESCVVKVEKGGTQENYQRLGGCITGDPLATGHSFIRYEPLSELRERLDALEGDKSYPRLEKDDSGKGVTLHYTAGKSLAMTYLAFNALCILAEKDLPLIQSVQGKWEDLTVWKGINDFPIGVWRYRRD